MSKLICILASLLISLPVADAGGCSKKLKDQFQKCLNKGFDSSIKGCAGADKDFSNKKQVKKCRKIEKKLKKCGHTCTSPQVDGGWSDFGDWSKCSTECGDGVQTRSRSCNNPAPANGGADCEGEETQTRWCSKGACQVDGGWSDFGDWSKCSVDCGDGVQTRSRSCNNPAPANGGADCEGEETQTRWCSKGACQVDGGWSDFGEWSKCSVDCGDGVQTRSRSCNNPAPANGGADCEGEETQTRWCSKGACQVDGGWSDFGDWSDCSAECGDGFQTRSRSCNNPAPANGGAECEGKETETRSCNMGVCPGTCKDSSCSSLPESDTGGCNGKLQDLIQECHNKVFASSIQGCSSPQVDGGWSDFGDWSKCSAECGDGVQTRSRSCNNPAPANGGADCEGEETQTRWCTKGACQVDGGWSDFGDWSECSAECGDGVQTRSRSCNNPAPANGGAECEGKETETRSCNMGVCPGTCKDSSCSPLPESDTGGCNGKLQDLIQECHNKVFASSIQGCQ